MKIHNIQGINILFAEGITSLKERCLRWWNEKFHLLAFFVAQMKMFSVKQRISKAHGIDSSLKEGASVGTAGWVKLCRTCQPVAPARWTHHWQGWPGARCTKNSEIHGVVFCWNLWVSSMHLYTGATWPVNEEPCRGSWCDMMWCPSWFWGCWPSSAAAFPSSGSLMAYSVSPGEPHQVSWAWELSRFLPGCEGLVRSLWSYRSVSASRLIPWRKGCGRSGRTPVSELGALFQTSGFFCTSPQWGPLLHAWVLQKCCCFLKLLQISFCSMKSIPVLLQVSIMESDRSNSVLADSYHCFLSKERVVMKNKCVLKLCCKLTVPMSS